MKSIKDIEKIPSDLNYNYQKEFTKKLDSLNKDFDQAVINELVLWKLNRYVGINEELLLLINSIDQNSKRINKKFTRAILTEMLSIKGIRIPMASTILRFRNPYIYQILDQRVYRFIMNNELKISSNVDQQIEVYLEYLKTLKIVCKNKRVNFFEADRIFYELDKRYNKNVKLKGYGKI